MAKVLAAVAGAPVRTARSPARVSMVTARGRQFGNVGVVRDRAERVQEVGGDDLGDLLALVGEGGRRCSATARWRVLRSRLDSVS